MSHGDWYQCELPWIHEANGLAENLLSHLLELSKNVCVDAQVGGGRDRTACRGAWRTQMSSKQYKQIVRKFFDDLDDSEGITSND